MTGPTIRSAEALRPPDARRRPVTRRAGAAAAFGIAPLAAAIAVPFDAGLLLLPGVPVATIMGYVLAPTVRLHGTSVGASVKMSISTVLLADAAVVVVMTIDRVVRDASATEIDPVLLLGEMAGIWFIGLLFYGLPALAFVNGPCSIAWVMLVTRLSLRSADNEAQ